MSKILKLSFINGISIKIDLIEAQKLFKNRAYELVDQLTSIIVERCFRKYGLRPSVSEKISYIEIHSQKFDPFLYGYIERELNNIEEELLLKIGNITHFLLMFYSKEKLEEIDLARYIIKKTDLLASQIYAGLGRAIWSLRRMGIESVPLGRIGIGIVAAKNAKLDDIIRLDTGIGEITFVFKDIYKIDFSRSRDRLITKKLIDYRIKEKFLSKGYIVDKLSVFDKYSIIESPEICIRPGIDLQTYVYENGRFSIAVSPRYSIEAVKKLSETGLKSSILIGSRVRRISDNLSGIITGIKGKFYEVMIDGEKYLEDGENLVKIYDISELRKIGLSKKFISILRMTPRKLYSYVGKYIDVIETLEIASQVIHLSKELPSVENI